MHLQEIENKYVFKPDNEEKSGFYCFIYAKDHDLLRSKHINLTALVRDYLHTIANQYRNKR